MAKRVTYTVVMTRIVGRGLPNVACKAKAVAISPRSAIMKVMKKFPFLFDTHIETITLKVSH